MQVVIARFASSSERVHQCKGSPARFFAFGQERTKGWISIAPPPLVAIHRSIYSLMAGHGAREKQRTTHSQQRCLISPAHASSQLISIAFTTTIVTSSRWSARSIVHFPGSDVPIVNSQRPAIIPEALRHELHTRADQLAAVYRRWLAELGIPGAQ